MAVVYRHRDNFNNIFYIGIGKKESRAFNYRNRSDFWKRYSKKYGVNTEIVAKNISYDDAKELEMLLISEYGRKDLGKGMLVNMTDGGDGILGFNQSEDTKRKIGKANSGGTSWSKGLKFKQEHKDKISKANKGKKRSKEQIKKMAEISKGNCYAGQKVLDVNTNTEYQSLKKYCEIHNIKYTTVWHNIKGKRKNNKYKNLKLI